MMYWGVGGTQVAQTLPDILDFRIQILPSLKKFLKQLVKWKNSDLCSSVVWWLGIDSPRRKVRGRRWQKELFARLSTIYQTWSDSQGSRLLLIWVTSVQADSEQHSMSIDTKDEDSC